MNDRGVHWFLIVIDLQHRCVDLLDSLPLNKSNDYRRELAEELVILTNLSNLVFCNSVNIYEV